MGRWRGDRWDDGFCRRRRVEDVPSLDIRAWRRRGLLTPPGRAFVASHGVRVEVGRTGVTLHYQGPDGRPVAQRVAIIWRRKTFGDQPMLASPCCGRRVLLLYQRLELWACRRCCGLRYESELELRSARGTLAAQRIQVRLGGDRTGLDLPNRPANMRQSTYERLAARHAAAIAKLRGARVHDRMVRLMRQQKVR